MGISSRIAGGSWIGEARRGGFRAILDPPESSRSLQETEKPPQGGYKSAPFRPMGFGIGNLGFGQARFAVNAEPDFQKDRERV